MHLSDLGMGERERELFDQVLKMPHGIVLVTGPTGSGGKCDGVLFGNGNIVVTLRKTFCEFHQI